MLEVLFLRVGVFSCVRFVLNVKDGLNVWITFWFSIMFCILCDMFLRTKKLCICYDTTFFCVLTVVVKYLHLLF